MRDQILLLPHAQELSGNSPQEVIGLEPTAWWDSKNVDSLRGAGARATDATDHFQEATDLFRATTSFYAFCIYRPNAVANFPELVAKWRPSGNHRQWTMLASVSGNGIPQFSTSDDGASLDDLALGAVTSVVDEWAACLVGWNASTGIKEIYGQKLSGSKVGVVGESSVSILTTAGINFTVGNNHNDTHPFDGRISRVVFGRDPTMSFSDIFDLLLGNWSPPSYAELSAAQLTALGIGGGAAFYNCMEGANTDDLVDSHGTLDVSPVNTPEVVSGLEEEVASDTSGSGRHMLLSGFSDLTNPWGSATIRNRTAKDLARAGRYGVLKNGGQWLADVGAPEGRAIDLDGDDQYVELGSVDSSHPLSGFGRPFSVEAWIKTPLDGDDFSRIIDKSSGGAGQNGWAFYIENDGTLRFDITSTETGTSTPGQISANTWTHVAATRPAGSAVTTLYVDGDEVSGYDSQATTTLPSTTTNCRIGTWNHSTGREFKGRIAGLRVYHHELSSSEVSERAVGNDIAPIAAWKMDDQSTGVVVKDTSRRIHDGTLVNFTDAELEAAWANDRVNLDGGDQVVNLGDVLQFERTDAFSVSCLVTVPDAGATAAIIGNSNLTGGGGNSLQGWELSRASTGVFRLHLINNNGTNNLIRVKTAVVPAGTYRVCATYDGSSDADGCRLYLDGVEDTTTETDNLSDSIVAGDPTVIGGRMLYGDNYLEGNAAEMIVWSRALTPAEAVAVTSGGTAPGDSRVLDMPLDDGDNAREVGTVTLNGTDEGLLGGSWSEFEPAADDAFSISIWAIHDGTTANRALMSNKDGAGDGWLLYMDDGGSDDILFVMKSDTTNQINITYPGVPSDEWHHLVLTYDGSGDAAGIVLYVDGNVATPTVNDDDLGAITYVSSFSIACRDNDVSDLPYIGQLSEVRFFASELTADEALDLYRNDSAPTPTGEWLLNDGDAAASSGVPVSSWQDRQGAAVLLQDEPNRRPLMSGDGVVFDGVDDQLEDPAFGTTQPATYFYVVDVATGDADAQSIGGNDSTIGSRNAVIAAASTRSLLLSSGPAVDSGLDMPSGSQKAVVAAVFNGASSYCWLNLTKSAALDPGSEDLLEFALGAKATSPSNYLDGSIREVVVYDSLLTDVHIEQIINWLAQKHGVAI